MCRELCGRDVDVVSEAGPTEVVVGFHGAECERVRRNRGADAYVAPVCLLGEDGLWAWLSLREVWEVAKRRQLAFLSFGLTVHVGYRGGQHKPQILRLEWPDGRGLGCDAGAAAEPHWQFDALESLRAPSATPAAKLRSRLARQAKQSGGAERFVPPPVAPTKINAVVQRIELSRMHLTTSAQWARNTGSRTVPRAEAPSGTELERWEHGALGYTVAELHRLVAPPLTPRRWP